jgi:hypothetical protein
LNGGERRAEQDQQRRNGAHGDGCGGADARVRDALQQDDEGK